MNEERYTLNLSRIELCDLSLACTSIIVSAMTEQANSETTPERKKVLDGTLKKWTTLRAKVREQIKAQDDALIEANA